MRRRSRKWEVTDRSSQAKERSGKMVSPRAVTAPLMPTKSRPRVPNPRSQGNAFQPLFLGAATPLVHRAVRARAASSRKVLTRCTAITTARAMESSFTTSSNLTSPAPTAASISKKTMDSPTAQRARCRFGNARNTAITSPKTRKPSSPEVRRWENSIRVSTSGLRGKTSPLHRGQWRPQPAPEPVART